MNATAANLMERVLPPESGLRQWVLTFPFSWRRRLAQDGALLGRLTRITVEMVLAFYAARAMEEGRPGATSGAVTAVQRTSSDMRRSPHLHVVALEILDHLGLSLPEEKPPPKVEEVLRVPVDEEGREVGISG
jgi:hypothetical protein